MQEESDKKDSNKEKCFVRGLKQTWYDEPLYIVNPLINMLFYNKEITKKGNSTYIQI